MQIVHVTVSVSVSVSICMSRNRVQFLILSAELQIYKCLVYDYFTTFELTKLFVCCSGLTNSNYTELSQLYEKYKDQGKYLILCVLFLNYGLFFGYALLLIQISSFMPNH